ncbi:30S ribosomal protein S13 [Candidatus Gottesmanbacteria bacterium]|nr:30S ribosomal protein S13 [Candidatus Gottesmanbacteria bacterium]MBI5465572.1 30S ribosomal protein S13 [Candidatus Gottesmanbacteria bacterium]
MVRIAGIDLADRKRIDFALTKIYGVGWGNVKPILEQARIDASKRTDELTEEETRRLQKIIDGYKIEGDLRRETQENIKRLKETGTYRGIRHARNLPVRGQRTRSNARTKRGKRVTIGAIKKEVATKMGVTAEKEKGGKGGG